MCTHSIVRNRLPRFPRQLGILLGAITYFSPAFADECSLVPDLCKKADVVDTQIGNTAEELSNQAESSLDTLASDVNDEATNAIDAAGEQLLPTANVAAQTAWRDAKAEFAIQQQPIESRAAAAPTTVSKASSSTMQSYEQDIQRLRATSKDLEEEARKLDGLDTRAKAYLDAELAAIQQKTDDLVQSLQHKLQGELNQWLAEEQSKPGDLLNMLSLTDITTDASAAADAGRVSEDSGYSEASFSLALFGINGGMVLPLSFRASQHLDLSLAVPLEGSRVDRLFGQIRLLSDLWRRANVEGYLQTNFNDENNVRVGAKFRQAIWRFAFSGDISRGWMAQEFTYDRRRFGLAIDLPWKQALFLAYNEATFRHRELESIVTSNEAQFGYRYVTQQYNWAPTGVELSAIAISPQNIVWKFNEQNTRLNGHEWNFGFGVGSRF